MKVVENSTAREPCADGAVVVIERSLLAVAAAKGRSYPRCARDAIIVALKLLLAGTESMPEAVELARLARSRQRCRTKFACGRGWPPLLPPHYLVVEPA